MGLNAVRGEATPQPKMFTVLPVRDGAQIAHPWRIWTGGDQVYAAKRLEQQLLGANSKASFHTRGGSALKAGHMRKALQGGFTLPDGWTHLLQLHFVVVTDALRPDPVPLEDLASAESKTKHLYMLECPEGVVLRLDVAVTRRSNDKPCPTLKERGAELLAELPLRSGGNLVTTIRWHPISDPPYQATLRDVMREAEAFRFKKPVRPENYYFEFDVRHASKEHSNSFSVFPVAWRWVAPASGDTLREALE